MLPSTAQLRQTGGRELKRIVFDEEAIAERVRELGREITDAYPDGDLLVLGLLKGSFIFLSDLVRRIERPLQVDFLVASSYGEGTVSSGNVRLVYDPETELEGKHILLVEDIIDTGKTLNKLVGLLRERRPLSFWALLIVGTIALVQLASSRRREEAEITYSQFMEELNAGNVSSVEIAERQKVRGAFQRPVVVKRQTVERFNVLLPFEADDKWVEALSTKGVDVRAREAGQSFGVVLLTFLPYLLIFGLVIFMLRQMQQGGNRAFAFGKSKAKLLAGDTPKVTFADVAGCD